MCNEQNFLHFANHCRQLLEERCIATHHDALQRMAETWLQLAAEEKNIADLAREADVLFYASNPDARITRAREIRRRVQ